MSAVPRVAHESGITFAPRAARWQRRSDGTLLIESPVPLGEVRRDLGSYLREWAVRAPDRAFLCERGQDGWRRLTYADALAQARCVAQWLIDRGLDDSRPVLILSPASIEHGLLALGCMLAGVPFSPVSPLLSQSEGGRMRLLGLAEQLQPALVFAQDGQVFKEALSAVSAAHAAPAVTVDGDGTGAIRMDALLATRATADVEARSAGIGPGTVVKYLFTSGSTGTPKAVPNTHGMLCANQRMMELLVQGDRRMPPVFLDWLPWSHTFGGNVTFHWILRDGGTLHLDRGRPVAGAFETTLANLREVSPTHFFNVPAGYGMLADALERDTDLAQSFFARLQFCFYGGASLPQATWDRMQRLSRAQTGREIVFTTGCGSTETGPIGTFLHWPVQRAGIIGLPAPGVQAKLVPTTGRLEMRLRGPNIFPGYLGRPEATAAAFDEEGFYRTGDAVRLVDPADPSRGLIFDGRVAEDFKLATGTFVQVGNVRVALLSSMRLLQDAVPAAGDRPWLGALVWLDAAACAALGGLPGSAGRVMDQRLRQALQGQLAAYNAAAGGSSQRIQRIRVLLEAPSADHGELTEKGYINQRAVLERRARDVDLLFAGSDDGLVIDALAGTSSLPTD